MSYPLLYKEKLPKDINNSYKELTPNDTVVTVTELEQSVSYENITATIATGTLLAAATAHTTSAYGQQFVEVLRKYGIGFSGANIGPATALSATIGAPTDTYPSITANAGSGVLLFTIPKNRYDVGIAQNTLTLSGKDGNNKFILTSSLTSSVYGKNVEIFPNPYFTDATGNQLGADGVSGFFFNDEGILGIVSSSANDINGYNPLSAFAGVAGMINRQGDANGSSVIGFTSQVLTNTINVACKVNPNELNFSLNPSAFSTTAEGGSASYGYNYIYRLPITTDGVSANTAAGDSDITYDGSGTAMTSTSISAFAIAQEFQSYVTGVGVYNDNNELLAIGKLGQPLKKSSTIPMTFLVSIDI